MSCMDMLGGRRHDRIYAYDTTIWHQDVLAPEKVGKQEALDAAASYEDGYRQFKIKPGFPR